MFLRERRLQLRLVNHEEWMALSTFEFLRIGFSQMPFLTPVIGPRSIIPGKQVTPHPLGLRNVATTAFP